MHDYKQRNTHHRLCAEALVIGACLIGASSCSSSSVKSADGGADSAVNSDSGIQVNFQGDRRLPLAPNDVEFIDFFVPHHESAVEMATMVVEHGGDSALKAMAMEMKTAQLQEIAVMRMARQALTGVAESPTPPADSHMQIEMQTMMAVSGAQLDRLFLEEMIPHHASGLPVAHSAQGTLVRSDLKTVAQMIYDAQAKEIGDMKMMLGEPTGGASSIAVDGGAHGDAGAASHGVDTAVTGDRRLPYTPADDVAFIDFLVPHHMMAMDMATMVVERGMRADLKMMAQMMKDSQMAEIAKMKTARRELTGAADGPALPADTHTMADMAAMMTLSGAALDTRFLKEMIPHHAGALPAVHRGRPLLQRPDMRQLAFDIYSAQAKEVGEMGVMLKATGGAGGGADASAD